MSATASATTPTPRRVPNPVAFALVGLGALLGVLSLTVLPWFRAVGAIRSTDTVSDIRELLDDLISRRRELGTRSAFHLGLSEYYYSWLAWLLLAAAVIIALVAAFPTREGGQVRMLGFLVSGLGVVATVWALDVYRPGHHTPGVDPGPSFADFAAHMSFGAWAALLAFVLLGLAAVLGPRRVRA